MERSTVCKVRAICSRLISASWLLQRAWLPRPGAITVIGRQIEVAEQIARPGDPHQYPITVLGWSIQTNKALADAVKHIRRRPGEEDDLSFRIAEIRVPEQELPHNLRRYIQVNQTILKGLKAI